MLFVLLPSAGQRKPAQPVLNHLMDGLFHVKRVKKSTKTFVSVLFRTILQRVFSAHVEPVSGVSGSENPERSGDKL